MTDEPSTKRMRVEEPPLDKKFKEAIELVKALSVPRQDNESRKPFHKEVVDSMLKHVCDMLALEFVYLLGVMAPSGTGKSTLLCALMGEDVLPTSAGEACTAAPIRVSYSQHSCQVHVNFMEEQQWKEEMSKLAEVVKDLGVADIDMTSENEKEMKALLTNWKAVYGEDVPPGDFRTNEVTIRLGGTFHETGLDVASAKAQLIKFVATPKPLACRKRPEFWPIVEDCSFSGPFEALKTGVNLVDLPGDQEINTRRAQIAAKYTSELDEFMICIDAVRAMSSEYVHNFLNSTSGAKKLVQIDGQRTLTVVVTKCDMGLDAVPDDEYGEDLTELKKRMSELQEAQRTAEVKAEAGDLEAALMLMKVNKELALLNAQRKDAVAHSRIKFYKPQLESSLTQQVNDWVAGQGGRPVQLRIFWTGAVDYMQLEKGKLGSYFCNKEHTGIPELQEHIKGSVARRSAARSQQIFETIDMTLGHLAQMGQIPQAQERFKQFFTQRHETLRSSTQEILRFAKQQLMIDIKQPVLEAVEVARPAQQEVAAKLASQWQGRYSYITYTAVMSHNGQLKPKGLGRDPIDLNKELIGELKVMVDKVYGKAFEDARQTCASFYSQVIAAVSTVCETLRRESEDLFPEDVVKIGQSILEEGLKVHTTRLSALKKQLGEEIQAFQQSNYDQLAHCMQKAMKPIYTRVLNTRGGKGVQQRRTDVLQKAFADGEKGFAKILHTVVQQYAKSIDESVEKLSLILDEFAEMTLEGFVLFMNQFLDDTMHGSKEVREKHALTAAEEKEKLRDIARKNGLMIPGERN